MKIFLKRYAPYFILAIAFVAAVFHCSQDTIAIKTTAKKALIEPDVTVLVLSSYHPKSVRIFATSKPGMTVTLGTERLLESACGVSVDGNYLGVRCGATESQKYRSLTIEDVNGPVGVEVKGQVTRKFRGKLIVQSKDTELKIINQIPLEDYLVSVVGDEMETNRNEAMKAQAVVARTYALRNRGAHKEYDFCDLTHCQAYRGVDGETPRAAEAVRLTRGQVIVYNGRLIQAFYHSTCGGHTNPPDPVWGISASQALPYLQGVNDRENCKESPNYRWTTTFTPAQVRELETEGIKASIAHIRVAEADKLGNVKRVEITTSTGKKNMTGYEFYRLVGQTIGWNMIKSTRFTIFDKNGRFYVNGEGLGHGIGMCQYGAMGLASKGKKYTEIIKFYFPGVEVKAWEGELPERN